MSLLKKKNFRGIIREFISFSHASNVTFIGHKQLQMLIVHPYKQGGK